MLTKEQKAALAQLVFNDRDILLGEGNPSSGKAEKQEKWIEIFIKLNAMGANIPDYKTLRDVEWSNLRRAAEKKLTTIKENDMKPEEERVVIKPFSPVEEIVLDCLGKGNGTTQKTEVDIPENASFMDPSFMARIKYEDDGSDNLDNDDSLGAAMEDYGTTSTRKRKRGRRGRPAAASASLMRSASPGLLDDTFPLAGGSDLVELRKKKLKLEITKLELEIEKLPLECAKLELEIQKFQRDLMLPSHHNMN